MQEYLAFLKNASKTLLSSKVDFLSGVLGTIFSNIVSMFQIWILASSFGLIKGWSGYELVFGFGIWLLSHSFYSIFFRNLETIPDLVVKKHLDKYFTLPVPILLQIIGEKIQYLGIADLLLSIGILVFSSSVLNFVWDVSTLFIISLFICLAVIVETSIALLLVSASFWLGRVESIVNIFQQFNYSVVQKFPLNLFPNAFQFFLTFILPFGLIGYYPTVFLLNKNDIDSLIGKEFIGFSWIVGLGILGAALYSWKKGLQRYRENYGI